MRAEKTLLFSDMALQTAPDLLPDSLLQEHLVDHFGGNFLEDRHLGSRAAAVPAEKGLTEEAPAQTGEETADQVLRKDLEDLLAEAGVDISTAELDEWTAILEDHAFADLDELTLEGITVFSRAEAKSIVESQRLQRQLKQFLLGFSLLLGRGPNKGPLPPEVKQMITERITAVRNIMKAATPQARAAALTTALQLATPDRAIEKLAERIPASAQLKWMAAMDKIVSRAASSGQTLPPLLPQLISKILVPALSKNIIGPAQMKMVHRIFDRMPGPMLVPVLSGLQQAMPAASPARQPEIRSVIAAAVQAGVRPMFSPAPVSAQAVQTALQIKQVVPDFNPILEQVGLTLNVQSTINTLTQTLTQSLDVMRPALPAPSVEAIGRFIEDVKSLAPVTVSPASLDQAVIVPLRTARTQFVETLYDRPAPPTPGEVKAYHETVRSVQTAESDIKTAPQTTPQQVSEVKQQVAEFKEKQTPSATPVLTAPLSLETMQTLITFRNEGPQMVNLGLGPVKAGSIKLESKPADGDLACCVENKTNPAPPQSPVILTPVELAGQKALDQALDDELERQLARLAERRQRMKV